MSDRILPRYPIYIPSKGRAEHCMTADMLLRDGVPFRLVVEPQEADQYAEKYGRDHLLVLPFSDAGSVIPARNWIKFHSIAEGHERHWQLDDNIRGAYRVHKQLRVPCDSSIALRVAEDFTDRYENIAISGLNYYSFVISDVRTPFILNCRVYSCSLINNAIPHQWRGRYNEDTDLCLQALADGWCTVLINAFVVQKMATMKVKGGNTATLYQGDGRLRMARALERLWPGVVTTYRRFERPQRRVFDSWRRFDTPLKLKPGIDLANMPPVDEYGLQLKQVREVKSPVLRKLVENAAE